MDKRWEDGSEVYFNQECIVKVTNELITQCVEAAKQTTRKKFRFCLQHSSADSLHEMLIVRFKHSYGRPDKHLYTTESHSIIEGRMLVILFEDNGEIRDVFCLSKENCFIYRIETNIYHMQIPLSEHVVYYETKEGPFNEKSNIYPSWAPEEGDVLEVKKFMDGLFQKLEYIFDSF